MGIKEHIGRFISPINNARREEINLIKSETEKQLIYSFLNYAFFTESQILSIIRLFRELGSKTIIIDVKNTFDGAQGNDISGIVSILDQYKKDKLDLIISDIQSPLKRRELQIMATLAARNFWQSILDQNFGDDIVEFGRSRINQFDEQLKKMNFEEPQDLRLVWRS